MEFPSIFWGLIVFITLLIIKIIIIVYKTRKFDLKTKLICIIHNCLKFKPFITLLFCGVGIYAAIEIITSLMSSQYPFNLQIDEDNFFIFFIGGIVVFGLSVYEAFPDEIGPLLKSKHKIKEKIQIDRKLIIFCRDYTKYKEKTSNPDLYIESFVNGEKILVKTNEINEFLSHTLAFDLRIFEPHLGANTLPIAKYQYIETNNDYSHFQIIEWTTNSIQYQEEIRKLLHNEDLDKLKPKLKLSVDFIADKCNYSEIKNLENITLKLEGIMEEIQNA